MAVKRYRKDYFTLFFIKAVSVLQSTAGYIFFFQHVSSLSPHLFFSFGVFFLPSCLTYWYEHCQSYYASWRRKSSFFLRESGGYYLCWFFAGDRWSLTASSWTRHPLWWHARLCCHYGRKYSTPISRNWQFVLCPWPQEPSNVFKRGGRLWICCFRPRPFDAHH